MAHLSLSLLGPFQVTLDGQPVTGFKSNKVRALLAYLAMEADQPHPREVLAGLLWPDWPDRDALGNLRYALSNLRQVIGDRSAEPPFLLITRDTLQFNPTGDHSLDVAAFINLIEGHGDLADLERATSIYRGGLLEGFSLPDAAPFEEWALLTRERLARQMSSTLHRLSGAYEARQEYEKAQSRARQQLELDPWDETAHQRLMRNLALGGQRSAALAQYEACRRLLAEELDVEPDQETTRLYEQISEGQLRAPQPPVRPRDVEAKPPPFLRQELVEAERPPFVARERELAELVRFMELAVGGQGRVAFVTGEAGSGKTALIQEFMHRAQGLYPGLLATSGNCNAHIGIGDPYLPFREILALLTGDVEARWAAGAMTRDHALRLWNALPLAVRTLAETGPELIDTLVSGAALLERAGAHGATGVEGVARLSELTAREISPPLFPGSPQTDLFEQYSKVLQALAREAPLLLCVDDLQWADLGSVSLLFHLGRLLAGYRILIVGAYRPEEVAIGRDGERHPLEPVVHELQREYGDVTVNLDQAEGRDFVEAFLDSEPNHLGVPFRERLYRQTRGHPLFTVELLRGMQERGDLVQDSKGRWVEGPSLDWETMPARMEAACAERIGRLDRELRTALRVASVEGENFTAEAVARVLQLEKGKLIQILSGELDRRHRLVRALALQRVGSRRLSRYQFRHDLFQKYLYENLDEVEQAYLHEEVGRVLEELYDENASDIAAQLARHYEKAGKAEKATHYLLLAGERALRLFAYQEAVAYLTRGLAVLGTLPHSSPRDEQELALQLALGVAWLGAVGNQSPQLAEAYGRARELCLKTANKRHLCRVLSELAVADYVGARHMRARDLLQEALSLAQEEDDPLLVATDHCHLGVVSFFLGEYATARTHLQQMIDFYDHREHHDSLVSLRGSDLGLTALAYDACCLWCLGYPDQALRSSENALALAHELDHPFSLADVTCYAGCVFSKLRRDAQTLKDSAEELIRISRERGVQGWQATGIVFAGQALAMLGQVQEGIAQMREGMEAQQSIGVRCYQTGTLCSLAEAYTKGGHPGQGLATLTEALALVEETGQRQWEAELYWLRGELLLVQGLDAEAEASLRRAIEVARGQQAKSWELRATTSLCRLLQDQGQQEEARRRLAEIYSWFTEGFDTPDLKEAKALLDELS
jgi:DNA-binding SARP family transcriptional activator/predicted ATPase